MSELRTDWLTDRAVLIAANRAARPNEFVEAVAAAGSANTVSPPNCPFCVGNEWKTPPALYEKFDDRGRWCVRVVPNMFPAVMFETSREPVPAPAAVAEATSPSVEFETTAPGAGAHEVINE